MLGWVKDLVGSWFVAARQFMAGIVGRVMTALGVTWTTTTFAMPDLLAWLQQHLSVSGQVLDLMSALNIDRAMTMIISAYVAKKALRLVFSPLSAVTGTST